MTYVHFAASKKKKEKKEKNWELTVYVHVYLFIILLYSYFTYLLLYSHWKQCVLWVIATNIIQYLLYLVLLVYEYLSVFIQLYLRKWVSYFIKELCNLSLEIQGPFTHSVIHAHLLDNRKSLTSHCKHLVESV